MMKKMFISIAALLFAIVPLVSAHADRSQPGAVYVMTNDPVANEVVVYDRDAEGMLTLGGSYSTGGLGIGGDIDPLASQGALIISPTKRWLFAANAGSNDISVFFVLPHGLFQIDTFDSGGSTPVSLALYHNLLYVLNSDQGGSNPNIAGFRLTRFGQLIPLPNSTRDLGPGGFHQVGFDRTGGTLVVSQGDPAGGNALLVFSVDEDGLPSQAPVITASNGVVPFGFIFDLGNHLVVSEAGSAAVSTYDLQPDDSLQVISPSVANGNGATCWIVGTWRGFVYTANTATDNISFYKVTAGSGEIELREAIAGVGNKPIDMATAQNGRYLYALNAADGMVGMFRTKFNGTLEAMGTIGGLPSPYAQGIAAR